MPVTPRGHNRTIGGASAGEFIDSQGGVGALMSRMDEYHDIVVRMRNERCVLMKEYPNQWVAMGKDGVVAVGNSIDYVLSKAEALGLKGGQTVVTEYLDTDPPGLIL